MKKNILIFLFLSLFPFLLVGNDLVVCDEYCNVKTVENFNKEIFKIIERLEDKTRSDSCQKETISLGAYDIDPKQMASYEKSDDFNKKILFYLNKHYKDAEMKKLCAGLSTCNIFLRFTKGISDEVKKELSQIKRVKSGKELEPKIVSLIQKLLPFEKKDGTLKVIASQNSHISNLCQEMSEYDLTKDFCFIALEKTNAYQFHVKNVYAGEIIGKKQKEEIVYTPDPEPNRVYLSCDDSDCDKRAPCGIVFNKTCYKTSAKKIRENSDSGKEKIGLFSASFGLVKDLRSCACEYDELIDKAENVMSVK